MGRSRSQLFIGEKIKEFRKNKGLSVRKFANIVGVTAGMISQVELNIVSVSSALLLSIKKAYPDTDMNVFFDKAKEAEK